jgi:predicted DNA-binding antitoxin AbrB/MazE fold protein
LLVDLEMLITALEEQHRRGGTEWGELQEDPHVENEHVGILPPTIVDLKRRKVVEFDEMDEESSSSSSVSLKEGQDVEWHGSAKETKRRKNVRAREGDRMRQSVRGADQVAERLAEMRKEQRHTDHDINKD